MDSRPIGVFDSGLGGLTAVKRLRELLPQERIVFLGDTANVPYGSRDTDTVRAFARADLAFMRARGVKLAAAACGTVSSNIQPADLEYFDFPFFDLIGPTASAAVSATRNGVIGLLATVATIASGRLAKAVEDKKEGVRVIPSACPELASLIEEGHTGPSCRRLTSAVKKHLAPILEAGADTIILGCTHYPLISDVIRKYAGEDRILIDSGAEEAAGIAAFLTEHDMLAPEGSEGGCSFFVTAEEKGFRERGSLFLGEDIPSVTVLTPGQFREPELYFSRKE